jgi:hypothetical protein
LVEIPTPGSQEELAEQEVLEEQGELTLLELSE